MTCIEPLAMHSWPPWARREMVWGTAEVGSAFFIAGAVVEVRHHRGLNVLEVGRCRSTVLKPVLKELIVVQCLKLDHNKLLSTFAFNFNLSQYIEAVRTGRWKSPTFWTSWNNLSGGIFYMIAACAGQGDAG